LINAFILNDLITHFLHVALPISPKIRTLAKKILYQPLEVNVAISKPSEGIDQQAYLIYDEHKMDLIKNILDNPSYESIIIFASRSEEHTSELQSRENLVCRLLLE